MNLVKPSAEEVGAAIKKWGRKDPRTIALTRQRMAALISAEVDEPSQWWWLSFAEPGRFLGLVIVKASGYMTAVARTHTLGINPGGEIAGYPISPEAGDPPEQYRDVLLDKETAEHLAEHGWST